MKWSNVRLVWMREIRDQLRDRRTIFTVAVLPILLYPLLGMSFLQVTQFMRQHPVKVWVIGAGELPPKPALIEGDHFAQELFTEGEDASLVMLEVDVDWPGSPAARDASTADKEHKDRDAASVDPHERELTAVDRAAKERLDAGEIDAVVFFPANFDNELNQFYARLRDRTEREPISDAEVVTEAPHPRIFYNRAKDRSRLAYERVSRVLRHWRSDIVQRNLTRIHIPDAATDPFQVVDRDLAEKRQVRAAVWSKILPFVVLIWALTGAFYPAVDLCAGEKERGTLETLLSSPAERDEIVWGKLLAVTVFSIATSLLNLASMGVTGTVIMQQIQRLGSAPSELDIGPPPLLSLVWLVVALVPISALFSALSLAIAAMARSTKEGQYYLMPLLLISMPLMMLPMLPSAQLDLGTALIPVTGVMLLLRSLIEGSYIMALWYATPVIAVTAVSCRLAIRWAIDQFNDESVLFRESDRLDLGLWLRHLFRDREDTPSAAEAILCGIVLLLVRFFAGLVSPPPTGWGDLAVSTVVLQLGLIAAPVVLMAVMLTKSPRKTLLLKTPRPLTLPAAILLAVCVHPVAIALQQLVQFVYPLSRDVEAQLHAVEGLLAGAPLWQLLLVLAVTPAICEELAFRGFILSGLRHLGHKWGAIVLSSVLFGIIHGMLQQSLNACLVGIVIGYVAVQTGSIWPGMLFHLTHNSLVFLTARITPELIQDRPMWQWMFDQGQGGQLYSWPVVAIGGAMTILLVLWFRRLPYQATDEERLRDALEHQSLHAGAG